MVRSRNNRRSCEMPKPGNRALAQAGRMRSPAYLVCAQCEPTVPAESRALEQLPTRSTKLVASGDYRHRGVHGYILTESCWHHHPLPPLLRAFLMIWPFLLIGLVAVALTLLFGWRRMYHRRRLLAGRSHPLAEELTSRSGERGWRRDRVGVRRCQGFPGPAAGIHPRPPGPAAKL